MQIDLIKIRGWFKSYLNYVLILVILIMCFVKCNPNPIVSNAKNIKQKENTIKSLLTSIKNKNNKIVVFEKKVAESDNKIKELLISLDKSEVKKDKDIEKVKDYDLKDFKRFFEHQTGSKEIAIDKDKLTFKRFPLDTLTKKLIDYDFKVIERDIYREAFKQSQIKSATKDTIININKSIISDLNDSFKQSQDIKDILKKDLKQANKLKIKPILISLGIGIITGLVISK